MVLTWIMFAVAISLSAVAAFYSIVGLAAIFSAAVWPIVIMGTILEVAKLTVTVWLHEYWRQCRWIMKAYLVPAVVVLMIITSMGIFGFLSKAHIDQVIPTGDKSAQLALFDERIANERAIVENSRSLIKQMDDTVNGIIAQGESREIKLRDGRTIVRSPAELALQVRRSQANDRERLTKTIEQAQARIVAIQEERAPVAKEIRGLEAEVGPIKYIAALIYGDNPDTNLLERAVRWMIIILVAVFDPLAVMMLLAATESLKWRRESQRKDPDHDPVVPPEPDVVRDADPDPPRDPEPEPDTLEPHVPSVDVPRPAYLDRGGFGFQNPRPFVAPAPEPLRVEPRRTEPEIDYKILDDDSEPDDLAVSVPQKTESQNTETQSRPIEDVWDDEYDPDDDDVIKQAKRLWKLDNPGKTLKEQRRLVSMGYVDHEPWLEYVEDPRISREAGFGKSFPLDPIRGDLFVKTDRVPTELYKYNGERWIMVDKNQTDNYSYNLAYIEHLVDALAAGQYDPDLLTDAERIQIEQSLAANR
jgi:hypothetical protein